MSGDPAPSARWLSIVGIGEDGVDGLAPLARRAIETARHVFGGKRHLTLAASLIRGAATPWPTPFSIEPLLARRGEASAVIASGDPFLYGVGNVIATSIPPAEFVALPAPSAFSLAASRLGWPLADAVTLSLHGRSIDLIRPHLFPGARILALTSDGAAPAAIAGLLAASGFGRSRVTVLEALGGRDERIRGTEAARFALGPIHPLNLLAIEAVAGPGARIIARAAGLDDALFTHDGQITKREIRALTLAALAPRPGELLWDIGAGSGSVAIEWLLADRRCRAIAIEPRADRAGRILENAAAFGARQLELVHAAAPEALVGLATPDAIFIGGGATHPGVLDAAVAALKPGGRLVLNAVTLETEQLLLARHAALGGRLIRIAIDRAEPLAGMTGWSPARPVLQWAWTKP